MTSHFRKLTKGVGVKMVEGIASSMRSMGKSLDKIGANMEVAKYTNELVPSTRFVAVDGVIPKIAAEGTFVAPTASVVGDVTLGKESSIWYGAKVRGDVNSITIGRRSHIMDRAVVHVAKIQGDISTSIGDNVTVGANSIIHAATLHDGCMIGEGAQVLDGAIIETNAVVAPGAIVTPGTTVSSGEYWSGAPATKERDLDTEELTNIASVAYETASLAVMHAEEQAKDYVQIFEEEDIREKLEPITDEEELARMKEANDQKYDSHNVQGQGLPGQVFNSTLTHPEEGLDLAMKLKYKKKDKYRKQDEKYR